MEGLGKGKGRPKDRARAPTVAVTGSGAGGRRSASVAASGGEAIAVYSSASVSASLVGSTATHKTQTARVIVRCNNQKEFGKDEARAIFTADGNPGIRVRRDQMKSRERVNVWTEAWT